jgi:hypothetical protein
MKSVLSVNRFVPYSVMALAIVAGGGSLLLFGVFLIIGPVTIVRFDAPEHQALLWNGLLSILFFVQHSGMIRASFRTWLAPIIPRHYHPSTYAIASGIALATVVLLWQPSQTVLYHAEGLLRLLARTISVLPSWALRGGCGHSETSTHLVWFPSGFIYAASNSGLQTSSFAVRISGSAILSTFS